MTARDLPGAGDALAIVGPGSVGVQELFRTHYLDLVRLAMRLVDDQQNAEDLVQDVFGRLAAKGPQLDDPAAYLQRAVVNAARSMLRRRRVARLFWSRAAPAATSEAADADALRRAERERVLHAIRALPARQREVVVLRYYEDLPVARIAAILAVSPGAVSTALNRALSALAPSLENRHDH